MASVSSASNISFHHSLVEVKRQIRGNSFLDDTTYLQIQNVQNLYLWIWLSEMHLASEWIYEFDPHKEIRHDSKLVAFR